MFKLVLMQEWDCIKTQYPRKKHTWTYKYQ